MELHFLHGDIVKTEKTDDGLIVHGKATGPDLDIDKQICDPAWLEKAMPAWMEWGNVREGHTNLAAGVGLELEQNGSDWHLKSLCVDPTTQKKLETGVLKGYSIGIKGARVVKDAAATGGRIVDGEIVEISYVDRPANPTAKITIAKAADGDGDGGGLGPVAGPHVDYSGLHAHPHDHGDGPHEHPHTHADDNVHDHSHDLPIGNADTKGAEPDLEKKDYSDKERADLASSGKAMPGGGYPIKTVDDLKNAIQAIGRAKDPAATKAHIKKRAAALGRTDLIPDGWKTATPDTEKADADTYTHDPADLAAVRDGIAKLMQAELDELKKGENETCDLSQLMCSLDMFLGWWCGEAAEGEVPAPYPQGDMTTMDYAVLGVSADTVKAATAEGATDDQKTALKTELVKALGLDTETITATIGDTLKTALEDRDRAIEERLATVEQMAAPGGPARTRTQADATKAAKKEQLQADADRYRHLALEANDPDLVQGYRQKAAEADKQVAALEQ